MSNQDRDDNGIQDRVALVTGGARRIGEAIVRELHNEGYRVAIHCRDSLDDAQTLASELNESYPDTAIVVTADLLDKDGLPEMVEEILGEWGRLDALVNNASSFFPTPLAEVAEQDWLDLTGSNLKAPLFLCQAAMDALIESEGGIVNIIDAQWQRPLADHPVYAAAKGGLVALTRSLARDLAPDVRVNGVAPGVILWPDNKAPNPDEAERCIQRIPMQRMGEPEDVAGAVRFLLSDEASFITGQILSVDGGGGLIS